MIFLHLFILPLLSIFCIVPPCIAALSTPTFPKEDFEHTNTQLRKADELFEAALYEKAIDAYKSLIHELSAQQEENPDNTSLAMHARFHLAHAYFSLGKDQEASDTLNENIGIDPNTLSQKSQLVGRHSLYLKALTLKNLQQYIPARNALLAYINSPTPHELSFREEALFEMGFIDFLNGDTQKAFRTFDSLKTAEKTKPRLYLLSRLYLVRIALQQGNNTLAAHLLDELASELPNHDPIRFEFHYLQGEVAFTLHDYAKAANHFNEALPDSPEKSDWYPDALYHLGWSYLKMDGESGKEENRHHKMAEETFDKLLSIAPEENGALALAQCYLIQANLLKDPEYYAKAEELLSRQELYISKEGKAQSLFLRAEAAPTYAIRDQFYRKLTEENNDSSIYYAKGWYMRALNDFTHGQELLKVQNSLTAINSFERSVASFRKSFEQLQDKEPQQAGAALKYQALAASHSGIAEGNIAALHILEELMNDHPSIWNGMQNRDEIYYLHGYFAGRITENTEKEKYLTIAERSLQEAASIPNNTFGSKALHHLGALYFKNNDYQKAEKIYLQLAEAYPDSSYAAEAWLWAANCADLLEKEPNIGKQRRRYAYENFPNTPYAAEAFFTYYTYSEYLQGDRTTIKHLQNFTDLYSNTPFLIDAHYLIGLDFKRDRKTAEGRWIRKKNPIEAIDSFQKAEMLFDELTEKNLIPEEKLNYYTAMRYRATLERGIINLGIANESQGAKQQIYLDYAEEVFKNLIKELQAQKNPYIQRLYQQNPYPLIEEESSFFLAQSFVKAGKDEEANKILSDILDRYQAINVTRSYYLSRALEEQGRIAMRKKDYQNALSLFKNAEDAAKGNVLSTDQRLELWLQQSLCYRGLRQFDDAILILSKVINDDAISALRVKAMYMRAETYELQKRPELARKQLESMVKKGGFWAKKAQEKLDNDEKRSIKNEH